VLGERGEFRADPTGGDAVEYEPLIGELDGGIEEAPPLEIPVIFR
jgi:hypothetical protein